MVKMPHLTLEGLYNKDKHILTIQLVYTDENGRKKVERATKVEKNTEKVRNAFLSIETELMNEIFNSQKVPNIQFYKDYIKNLLNIDLKEVEQEIPLKPTNYNYIFLYKDYLPYVPSQAIATKEAVAKEQEKVEVKEEHREEAKAIAKATA